MYLSVRKKQKKEKQSGIIKPFHMFILNVSIITFQKWFTCPEKKSICISTKINENL